MAEEVKAEATTQTDAKAEVKAEVAKEVAPETKADGQKVVEKEATSLMDEATAEEKAAQEAEEKRLLETKDEELSDEDKTKKAEIVKAKAAAEAAKGAPEKYEFKIPEGMVLDQALVNKATPILKEANVTQATAQKLVDLYAERVKADGEAQATNFNKFVEDLKAETIKTLGANYKQELAFAAKSRDRFASPELVQKLNISGLANDKDMIALFIRVGRAISEDKVVEGRPAVTTEKDDLGVLYDNTPKKK